MSYSQLSTIEDTQKEASMVHSYSSKELVKIPILHMMKERNNVLEEWRTGKNMMGDHEILNPVLKSRPKMVYVVRNGGMNSNLFPVLLIIVSE